MGRMTYDADVLASPELLAPVAGALAGLVDSLTEVIQAGIDAGELRADVHARAVASTVAAVVQGGYVLARAHDDASAFDSAVDGAVTLLAGLEA